MPNLGTFLLLAFIGPGLVIFCGLMLLWPELRTYFYDSKVEIYLLVIMSISFLNGHLPFVMERLIFVRVWKYLYPGMPLEKGKELPSNAAILIKCESRGYNHNHYDQLFGEFILYYNTSFWLVVICVVRIAFGFHSNQLLQFATAMILACSLVALLYTSPMFKAAVIQSLKEMHELPAAAPIAKAN